MEGCPLFLLIPGAAMKPCNNACAVLLLRCLLLKHLLLTGCRLILQRPKLSSLVSFCQTRARQGLLWGTVLPPEAISPWGTRQRGKTEGEQGGHGGGFRGPPLRGSLLCPSSPGWRELVRLCAPSSVRGRGHPTGPLAPVRVGLCFRLQGPIRGQSTARFGK